MIEFQATGHRRQIEMGRDPEPGGGRQRFDRRPLVVTDLQQRPPITGKEPGQLGQDRPVRGKAIGPAVECRPRLEAGDFRLQSRDLGRADVGRVADHEVERAGHTLGPRGALQPQPLGDAEALRVQPGTGERRLAQVRADAVGTWKQMQQCEQQAAGADADIEHA